MMKNSLHWALPAALLVVLGATAQAQAPAPSAIPGGAPAEVVPPKAPTTPAPGQKTAEVPDKPEALSPGTPAPHAPAGAAEKAGVDALDDAEVEKALAAIKEQYVRPVTLSEQEMKRATLQGLLSRLGPGARLQTAAPTPKVPAPFRSEVIENRVGYVRLGDALSAQAAELDAALKQFADQKIEPLIVDLRAVPAGTDLEGAGEVCRRFVPKGKVLFSLRSRNEKEQLFTSKDDPAFKGLLVVLVDADASGSAEIIAAVLRAQAGAMVIGERTRGEAAEFAAVPLSGGKALRIAIAEVSLPDNVPLFPDGVVPDLNVEVPPATTVAVLKQGLEGGVGPLVTETERPKMNEAALVAGTNPELEAAIQAQRNRGEKGKVPLKDAVLQRAVDFVTTVAIYEKGLREKR